MRFPAGIAPHHPAHPASRQKPLHGPQKPMQAVLFAGGSYGKANPNCRILGHSTAVAEGGNHYRHHLMILWDKAKSLFKVVEEFFYLDFQKTKSYIPCTTTDHEMVLNHGEVLGADFIEGAIVDQLNQRILLPDGRWIDGPTGDIYTAQDVLILSRDKAKHPAREERKDL